jgi:hypothetical protein
MRQSFNGLTYKKNEIILKKYFTNFSLCINNVVCAHEVLHQIRLFKTKDIFLKIDFEKVSGPKWIN